MTDNYDTSQAGLSLQKPAKWNAAQKYVIFLLLLVHMFNLMDRQIINVLSPAIQQDFNLNDFQVGILTGLPFALLYAIFGFPIARIAVCLLYTSPSPRDKRQSRMPSSA